jgi:hypothetical protein
MGGTASKKSKNTFGKAKPYRTERGKAAKSDNFYFSNRLCATPQTNSLLYEITSPL